MSQILQQFTATFFNNEIFLTKFLTKVKFSVSVFFFHELELNACFFRIEFIENILNSNNLVHDFRQILKFLFDCFVVCVSCEEESERMRGQ